MTATWLNLLIILGATAVGVVCSTYLLKGKKLIDIEKNSQKGQKLLIESKEESVKIMQEAEDYVQKKKSSLEQEILNKETRFKKLAESLNTKEQNIKKREDRLKEERLQIASYQEETQSLEDSIKKMDLEILEKLAQKSNKSPKEEKEKILKQGQAELESENAEKLAKIEEMLKENADRTAKSIVINIIQRMSSPTSVETRAINVNVPKDHIKGKIVGKDGQNILEFERLLDVDVVFNDLPQTISLSAFRLVERRTAQKAMEKLVDYKDEINPETIRKVVEWARKETDDELYEIGSKALERMHMKHENKEFCRIVGRLQYRTSYGQNILKHSMEVGWAAAMIGSELGLDVNTCKVAGFLHDVGKAIDQDPNVKDAHDYLSKEIMEKFGFTKEEVHAAWTHHDAIPQETAEALIVKAADAISASRPGARQESFAKYIERIKALEETAESYEGVKKAFAISAGREIRVMVDPETVDEARLLPLATEVANQIEKELTYPGQIKVNVIRRTRHTEIAK